VRGLSPWDLRAETAGWVDADLLDVVATDVTSIRLTGGNGSFELTRSDDGGWRRVGNEAAVDPSQVEQFLRSIEGLTLSEPAGRFAGGESFGLDDPAMRVELRHETTPGVTETVVLRVGDVADEESGKRYARVDGSQFVVVLSKWDADRLVDQEFDDLSPAEVEPAP
jgi:predicted Rdx family selenoprotein